MSELKPLPCPECGKDAQVIKIERNNNKPSVFVCLCQNHPCTDREAVYASPSAAIAAWNNLPRMSTIIAWQFQAAGAALALQRIMDAGIKMRGEQHVQWLLGNNKDSVTDAEAVFDGLLAWMMVDKRTALNFVK